MELIRRLLNYIFLICSVNILLILKLLKYDLPAGVQLGIVISGMIFLIFYNIRPLKKCKYGIKLSVLLNACELIRSSFLIFIVQTIIYIFLLRGDWNVSGVLIWVNLIFPLLGLVIILLNGMVRIALVSSQTGPILKVLMFVFWWTPIVNIFIFSRVCHISRREYNFEISKIELGQMQEENEVCKTKYPILMVHGIFFRDWQFFNYWGRIPKQLIKGGAKVYYGNQHSAAKMEICTAEIKNQILHIIENEQCEKVNIIAHSKGGIDARYAISCLGMDEYVASLTTIGTPHKGSALADHLLGRFSIKLVRRISKFYDWFYKRLGDEKPDFYSGVLDLTTEQCAFFNEKAVDMDGVHYQSYGSKMSHTLSAGFPLNVGYMILKPLKGENDGFVAVEESKYGEFLGCVDSENYRGVSHGDMIDLKRDNIKGFDVRDFYVDLVHNLKVKGY